jgi:NADH-quinone oxidoreductase subunit J
MTVGNVFFALFGIVSLVGALVTVLARNPIRGAVGLLVSIIGIAALFLRLDAQFLAAIQLIVYAGAVVVLFVFVIMLLGPDALAMPKNAPRGLFMRALSGVVIGALAGVGGYLLLRSAPPVRFTAARPEHGSVEAVGQLLFSKAVVPFELATALLVVAAIGAIAVARVRHQPKARKAGDNPTRRLFHGPIHPRDAGRPLEKPTAGGSADAFKDQELR